MRYGRMNAFAMMSQAYAEGGSVGRFHFQISVFPDSQTPSHLVNSLADISPLVTQCTEGPLEEVLEDAEAQLRGLVVVVEEGQGGHIGGATHVAILTREREHLLKPLPVLLQKTQPVAPAAQLVKRGLHSTPGVAQNRVDEARHPVEDHSPKAAREKSDRVSGHGHV